MSAPAAFTVFGLGLGTAILLAVLLVLYVWFCVYWWRGGRPMSWDAEAPDDEHPDERPRHRAA